MSSTLDQALRKIKFNEKGLIPAIAQDAEKHDVLMMAWMNKNSIKETLKTGRVCYWSRSRRALWRKGESSGQEQQLVDLIYDCDGDTILLKVKQTGVACHTGRRSCFHFSLAKDGTVAEAMAPEIAPHELYNNSES